MNKVELQTIVGGALQEKFSKAFESVVEDIQDLNTSFKIKRGRHMKGQMNIDDYSHSQVIDGSVVDTDTGEIIEESSAVVDFRKANVM